MQIKKLYFRVARFYLSYEAFAHEVYARQVSAVSIELVQVGLLANVQLL